MDVELTLDAFREARLAHRIEVATGGQQALDYAFGIGLYADRGRFPLPDVILLDLKMPGIDGFEVLRRLKADRLLRRVPVIVLTSSSEEGDLTKSYDIGTNSYLVKPAAFHGFVDVVSKIDHYWLKLNVRPGATL